MSKINRYTMTAGTVRVTVRPSETYIRARELLGDEFRPEYTFRVVRKDSTPTSMVFMYSLNTKPGKPDRWVYMGALTGDGVLRLTSASAFKEHATRVKAARIAIPPLFAGRPETLRELGWSGVVKVESELPDRF